MLKTFPVSPTLPTHPPPARSGVVLPTSTRGDLCMLIMESLGICRELLRVGEWRCTVHWLAGWLADSLGGLGGLAGFTPACRNHSGSVVGGAHRACLVRAHALQHRATMLTVMFNLHCQSRAEGVDVINMLQQRDEAEIAQHGAARGSATRQKWLHTIHVRPGKHSKPARVFGSWAGGAAVAALGLPCFA